MDGSAALLILVVDDEPLVADVISVTLEDHGYVTLVAGGADAALRVIESRSQELCGLVTDINLGGPQTGWDLARRARELVHTLAVIYMTGDSSHQWASRAVPESTILTKPFSPMEVVVALRLRVARRGNQG